MRMSPGSACSAAIVAREDSRSWKGCQAARGIEMATLGVVRGPGAVNDPSGIRETEGMPPAIRPGAGQIRSRHMPVSAGTPAKSGSR
jgi:hypothetical protein